jgi:hypothetical protein
MIILFYFKNFLEKGGQGRAAGWGYWKGLTQTRKTQAHLQTGSQRGANVWRLGASGNFHDRERLIHTIQKPRTTHSRCKQPLVITHYSHIYVCGTHVWPLPLLYSA